MRRGYGMSGPLPITNTEIDAWQRVHGIRLTPWELDCIYLLDGLALEASRKEKT